MRSSQDCFSSDTNPSPAQRSCGTTLSLPAHTATCEPEGCQAASGETAASSWAETGPLQGHKAQGARGRQPGPWLSSRHGARAADPTPAAGVTGGSRVPYISNQGF